MTGWLDRLAQRRWERRYAELVLAGERHDQFLRQWRTMPPDEVQRRQVDAAMALLTAHRHDDEAFVELVGELARDQWCAMLALVGCASVLDFVVQRHAEQLDRPADWLVRELALVFHQDGKEDR